MEETRRTRHDHRGEKNPFFGHTHGEESKAQIGATKRLNSAKLQELIDSMSAFDKDALAEFVAAKVVKFLKVNNLVIFKEVEDEPDEKKEEE